MKPGINRNQFRNSHFLDYSKEQMDPAIWQGDPPILKPEVEEAIQLAIDEFQERFDLTAKDIQVFISGSLTGRAYTSDTDLDIHIIMEDETNLTHDSTKEFTEFSLSRDFDIAGHPVQFYAESKRDVVEKKWYEKVDKLYDFDKQMWVKSNEIEIKDPLTEFSAILDKTKSWAQKIDLDLGEARRDLILYQSLLDELTGVSKINQKLMGKHILRLKEELDSDIEKLLVDKEELHKLRLIAFEKELSKTEETSALALKYHSRNLLPENLIFKLMEKYRYIKLLKDIQEADKDGVFKDYSKVDESIFYPSV